MRSKPTPAGTKKCPQCSKFRKLLHFIADSGHERNNCNRCRKNKALFLKGLRPSIGKQRRGLATAGDLRVRVVMKSGSEKLGGLPASITTANTCPPSCGLYANGCYAEFHLMRVWWSEAQKDGLEWAAFLQWVRELPADTLWRHNLAGDLPGTGESVDLKRLSSLALANSGRRGFTFTHKPLGDEKFRQLIGSCNLVGFTINLSADGLYEADAKAALGIAPVVVVLPADAPAKLHTPNGRRVVVCPAQTHKDMTCAKCQLCARPQRSAIIGFRAHGQMQNRVSRNLVQLRLKLSPDPQEAPNVEAIIPVPFAIEFEDTAGHGKPGVE